MSDADEVQRLFDAIRAGDAAAVERCLGADASLAAARRDGVSAVLWARYCHRPHVAKAIRARLTTLDLFEACALGEADRVAALLAGDATRANAVAPDGFGPLRLACFFDHEPIVRLLLAADARVDQASANGMKVMPLHSAAAARSVPICRLLLEAGAPVNARQGHELGFTPLMEAALNGQDELVDLLLAHGADAALLNDESKSAADHARSAGHTALADRLV